MSESEITPDPNPLHQRPPILKRGHLLPTEWDHKFDPNNQPIRPGVPESLGGDIPDRDAPIV
jgi:hypothetical protein